MSHDQNFTLWTPSLPRINESPDAETRDGRCLGLGATDDIFVSDRTVAEIGAYRAKVMDAMFRGLKTVLSLPLLGVGFAVKR